MKLIKTIDVWAQIILFTTGVLYSFAAKGDHIFIPYFIVGGWQLFSMILHDINRWFASGYSKRRRYRYIAYTIVVLMLASIAIPVLLYIYPVLFFAVPLMTLYYISICYNETRQLLSRPLSQLK